MKMKKIIFTLMFSLIGIAVSFSQAKGVTIDNALTQAAEKFSSSLKTKQRLQFLEFHHLTMSFLNICLAS